MVVNKLPVGSQVADHEPAGNETPSVALAVHWHPVLQTHTALSDWFAAVQEKAKEENGVFRSEAKQGITKKKGEKCEGVCFWYISSLTGVLPRPSGKACA